MDIDPVPYIFGSFARRRHSHHLSGLKKPTTVQNEHTIHSNTVQPQPQQSPSLKQQLSLEEDSRYICTLCKKLFLEPRVLSCLHTFCTRCLQDIESKECNQVIDNESSNNSLPVIDASGCYTDGFQLFDIIQTSNGDKNSNNENNSSIDNGVILCPICDNPTKLNCLGVLGLPPDYIAQHRIVLATLCSENTRLLCDLCTSDITASHRCSKCLVNLCDLCTESHRRREFLLDHEILTLRDVREKGVMKLRRQIMCHSHPECELYAYCTRCSQVVCRNCIQTTHTNHACESAPCAFHSRTTHIQNALHQTRLVLDEHTLYKDRLHEAHASIDEHCKQLENEIESFIESYKNAVETHRLKLLEQVSHVREEKLKSIECEEQQLEVRVKQVRNTIEFTEELLNEGTDIEMLTFIDTVLKKFEQYATETKIETCSTIPDNCLYFVPNVPYEEEHENPFTIFGLLTTNHVVDPKQCVLLYTDDLNNIRVNQKVELLLETRDETGKRIQYENERIHVELIENATMAQSRIPVNVTDKQNGIYSICFTPNTTGTYSLIVKIKNQIIHNCPLSITVVQNIRTQHTGVYHCCSFCSSRGNKEATCACGGKMVGGYKGCGHGHGGHPGRKHWSCCGLVTEHSDCKRIASVLYQITL